MHGHNIVVPYRDECQPHIAVAVDIQMEKVLAYALESGPRDKAVAMIDEWFYLYVEQAKTSTEVHENILLLSSLIIHIIIEESINEDIGFMRWQASYILMPLTYLDCLSSIWGNPLLPISWSSK
ncbi:hypothetical protein GCM10008018_44220 [Paenibacillus marchantiophytorum]|uniref:Uncharacterized protein n=1 Tax=Paenibacillus marchantiophytorum TaxID=1619310 RepID=A0ABQ1EZ43_9BACL|nr:hypothetical protein [Paenibacillus marchantiophytorum]GFZ93054.1 hypothetical protein GCM10008018_44220 [Paenibacillus marchantiophytorum]